MIAYLKSAESWIAVVRTLMSYVWSFLLVKFAFDVSPELQAASVVIIGTVTYQLIRTLAERWPWFGNLLGVNKAPSYEA